MRVGVFDSGIGGLTVVKSLMKHKLFSKIIYMGDTARVPYGTKNKNTIIRYSLEALEYFKNYDLDILIAACNSVSAYAIPDLKKNAPFEVVGVIEPGVKALTNKIKDKDASVLITGTKATISSGKYKRLLAKEGYLNIQEKATGLFVSLVEEKIFSGKILDATMKHYFKNIKEPDALILGCTHFPLIEKEIQKYYPKTTIIHSGEAIVEYLENEFGYKKRFDKCDLNLFSTENPGYLKEIASEWLKD